MRVLFLCCLLSIAFLSQGFIQQSLTPKRSLSSEAFDSSSIEGFDELDATDQNMIEQFFGALLELDDAFQGFNDLPQFDEPSRRLREVTLPHTEIHHARYQSHHSGEGFIPHHIPHLAKKTDNLFLLGGRNLQSNWTYDDSDWDFMNDTDLYWNNQTSWANSTYPTYPIIEQYPVYYPQPTYYQYDTFMPAAQPMGP